VRNRVAPAVFYYYKTLGLFGEYMRSAQDVAKAGVNTHVVDDAWEATGSLFLTGEPGTYGLVRPKNSFDPAAHHWGALQLVARVAKLTVDGDVFTNALAASGASREAKQVTLGANWYPSQMIKIYGTFERTVFDGNTGARPAEDVILFRTQLGF
jgi:phosphate-selective porin OprO/OprP